LIESKDSLSGIDHYEVKIDGNETKQVVVAHTEKNPYRVSPQAPGKHTVMVKAVDKAGNFTSASKEVIIQPKPAPPGFKIFGKLISYSIAMITLLVIIGLLVLIIIYQWYRFSIEKREIRQKKRLKKEIVEAKESVRKAFRALREEVQEQIEYFDKKPGLNKGEKEIRNKLRKALNISEEFIGKEIKDIEKKLEKK